MKIYELEEGNPLNKKYLLHLDVYRLEEIEELRPLRFTEYLDNEDSIMVVEWADRILPALPSRTIFINFQSVSLTERQLVLKTEE